MTTGPKANDIIISIDTSATASPTFVAVGVMRAQSLSFNSESVDITSTASANWRELLSGGGVRSMTISGSGIFKDTAGQIALITAFTTSNVHKKFSMAVPGVGTYVAEFQITSLELSGDANGNVDFSLTLESATAPVFTAS